MSGSASPPQEFYSANTSQAMSDSVSSGPNSYWFDEPNSIPANTPQVTSDPIGSNPDLWLLGSAPEKSEDLPLDPFWYEKLPEVWDPTWIMIHDEGVRSRDSIPPLLFRGWSQGSGGPAQEPGNNPTLLIPPGFLDPDTPRGRAPHEFLTPKQFVQLVLNHFRWQKNIREDMGYETLFMSYTQSPTFAWQYAQTLATVKPTWTPEQAKNAHVSMIDTNRLGPDTFVYHCPKLAELFHRMSAKSKRQITFLENCSCEYLVFGVVDAYARPGCLSSLPCSRMAKVDMSSLDGLSDFQRQLAAQYKLPDLKGLRNLSVMPLTQDLFPVLTSLVGPMPRLRVLSACWMVALSSMARRSEPSLVEGNSIPTDFLVSIASEVRLKSYHLDELLAGYERITWMIARNDDYNDCLQLYRLAFKFRNVLRQQERKPPLPSSFSV